MCKAMEDMRNETIERRNVEIAKEMIADGKLSLEKIAQYSKLALDKVKELAAPKPAQ